MTDKFNPGHVLATAAVAARIPQDTAFNDWVVASLRRHLSGDWGNIEPSDARLNDLSLASVDGGFHSVYSHPEHPTIWIITDQGRAVTTILFPDDY